MNTRDTKRFRHKGKEGTSIKTKTGLIEYERVKYIETKEDGSKQCRYLLDEELGIKTVIGGQVSEGLDGASWIKKLVPKKGIYQADCYHLKEKINTNIRDKEDANKVIEMYWKQEYEQMIEYVENLKYKYDGEYEEITKLNELKKYLEKRKDYMRRYNTSKEMKKRLKEYSKKTGLEYRNMGCQESNNYAKITRRFKRRRMRKFIKVYKNLIKFQKILGK